MKFEVEAHVKKWIAPDKVHFDEGLKLPLDAVPKASVRFLIRQWVSEVCDKAGLVASIKFEDD